MAEAASPIPPTPPRPAPTTLADHSLTPTWRVFGQPVPVGVLNRRDGALVWSVSPGEATVLGPRPGGNTVDLTHVRAVVSVTGPSAVPLLTKLCHLDLPRFDTGQAARTRLAGVATELLRPEPDRWILLPSSSFAAWLWETLLSAGPELDVGVAPPNHDEVT